MCLANQLLAKQHFELFYNAKQRYWAKVNTKMGYLRNIFADPLTYLKPVDVLHVYVLWGPGFYEKHIVKIYVNSLRPSDAYMLR